MPRERTRLQKYTHKATNQLAQSHCQRCWAFRKRFPKCHRLNASPLCLLGYSNYESCVLDKARSAGVRTEDYGKRWFFSLIRQPKAFKDPSLALHSNNLGVVLRQPRSLNRQHNVLNKRVLDWLIVLRDESLLLYSPGSSETLSRLESIARLTLRIAPGSHITTSVILGLRLMGFDLVKGHLFECLKLNIPSS